MDIQKILLSNTSLAIYFMQNIPSNILINMGRKKAEHNFKQSLNIEAYKRFLRKKSDIPLTKLSLNTAPITDKKNYIKQFELDELVKEPVDSNYTIEQSSGFSGEPFFWPRFKDQDANFVNYLKLGLVKMFSINNKSTLLINSFALGTWVTGVKLSRSLAGLANLKDLKSTAVNTGTNKLDIIKILAKFEKYYDQIIIFGYPPFLADLIETIVSEKTVKDLKKVNCIAGGEGFPEEWRDYVSYLLKYNVDESPNRILSAFGSADTGLEIGYEHPITVIFRRLLREKPEIREEILKEKLDYTPHFFQYNPLNIWIEEYNKELLFTSNSAIPINRYNLHDKGGILQYNEMINVIAKHYNINKIKERLKPFHLPIVYLYGRSDGTISIDGENFYIPDIQGVLNRYLEIKELINHNLGTVDDVLKLIPHRGIAEKIYLNKDHIHRIQSKTNIVNSFKLKENSNKLEIYIELDKKIYINSEQIQSMTNSLYKALCILFYKYLLSYRTLVNENLRSADIRVHVLNYREGIFADSQNKIKLNYKFS